MWVVFYPASNQQLSCELLQGPYYRTASFWKRFSVVLAISLSIASLIVNAYANLAHPDSGKLKGLELRIPLVRFWKSSQLIKYSAYCLWNHHKRNIDLVVSIDESGLEEAGNS